MMLPGAPEPRASQEVPGWPDTRSAAGSAPTRRQRRRRSSTPGSAPSAKSDESRRQTGGSCEAVLASDAWLGGGGDRKTSPTRGSRCMGGSAFQAARELLSFVSKVRSAQSDSDLDEAAKLFAAATVRLGST